VIAGYVSIASFGIIVLAPAIEFSRHGIGVVISGCA
jgi:hypothetical protein